MARIAYCVAQKRCKACVNDKVHTEVVERQGKGDKSTTTLSCRDTPCFVTKECQINFLLYNRLPRPPPILPLSSLLLSFSSSQSYPLPRASLSSDYLMPMHQTSIDTVEDMANLGDLHEASILFNIQQRYLKDFIYVRSMLYTIILCTYAIYHNTKTCYKK